LQFERNVSPNKIVVLKRAAFTRGEACCVEREMALVQEPRYYIRRGLKKMQKYTQTHDKITEEWKKNMYRPGKIYHGP